MLLCCIASRKRDNGKLQRQFVLFFCFAVMRLFCCAENRCKCNPPPENMMMSLFSEHPIGSEKNHCEGWDRKSFQQSVIKPSLSILKIIVLPAPIISLQLCVQPPLGRGEHRAVLGAHRLNANSGKQLPPSSQANTIQQIHLRLGSALSFPQDVVRTAEILRFPQLTSFLGVSPPDSRYGFSPHTVDPKVFGS